MRSVSISLAAVLAVTVAACAQPNGDLARESASAPRACFFVNNVNGFSQAGRDAIHVHISPRSTFEIEAIGPCNDLDWASQVALRSATGSSSLCTGDLAVVQASSGLTTPIPCHARVVRRVTAEAEAEG